MSEAGPGLDAVGEIIADAVAAGGIPGVVAAAGRGSSVLGTWTAGFANATPNAPPSAREATPGTPEGPGTAPRRVSAETLFDLASLTKVVSTTTLVLSLAGSGSLSLDAPVARYLPAAPWDVTIRQLLSHTSGLPSTVKFYESCSSRGDLLDALFATPLEAPPGTRVAYSDLGFMTLGEVVTAVTGSPLDAAFRQIVARPLGLADTGYRPAGPASRFAATELRDDGTPWTGIVHDENARVMDGVAGHAGLFAPVADLARFASWWVSASSDSVVPARLRREAERCQTSAPSADDSLSGGAGLSADSTPPDGDGVSRDSSLSSDGCLPRAGGLSGGGCLPGDGGLPGRRGLGWVLPGDRYDILFDAWPPSAVSHTGFTGTSIALDSASGAWLVLLTNRVHFGRTEASATAIKALRHAAHTAAAKALLP